MKFNATNPISSNSKLRSYFCSKNQTGPLRVIEGAAIPTSFQYIKSIDVPHKLHLVYIGSPVSSFETRSPLGHYPKNTISVARFVNSIRIGKQLTLHLEKFSLKRQKNGNPILSQTLQRYQKLTSAKMFTVLRIYTRKNWLWKTALTRIRKDKREKRKKWEMKGHAFEEIVLPPTFHSNSTIDRYPGSTPPPLLSHCPSKKI